MIKNGLKNHSPLNIGVAFRNDADGKWYPAINGAVDTVKHTISIKTKHFSYWTIFTCFHLYMRYGDQLSEDNSGVIKMPTSKTAYLLVVLAAPPAWKSDPDKAKFFTAPLVVPLVPNKIDPKEDNEETIKPDHWMVENIENGNPKVGTINMVDGRLQYLYRYNAPASVPGNGDVDIVACLRNVHHRRLWLLQAVKILGPDYQIAVTDSMIMHYNNFTFIWGYHYSGNFHINEQSQIVYDGENHKNLKFYKIEAPGITWTIKSDNYLEVSDITGSLNEKTNKIDGNLNISFFSGTTSQTICDDEGCVSKTINGSKFNPGVGSVHLNLKNENGYTFKRDTILGNGEAKVHLYETFTLKHKNGKN